MTRPFTLGAVAYDPKVVTIWEGFADWFASHGFAFDYVLYSSYEAQAEAHLAGHVDVTWDSPLAWVRTRRLAEAAGREARAVAMRDTDQDLTSVVLVRADSDITDVAQLAGRTVACGAVDSPQATLLPLAHLAGLGLDPGSAFSIQRHDVMVTKHGDHVGGERDAVKALLAGQADAACVIDGNHLAFAREGTIPPDGVRVLTQTAPYDHCTMTVLDDVDTAVSRPVRGPAAVDVVRRPGGAAPAGAGGPAGVAGGPHRRLPPAGVGRRPAPVLRPRWLHPGRGLPPSLDPAERRGLMAAPAPHPTAGGDDGPAGAVELGPLGLDGGAHVLVKLALTGLAPGQRVTVRGDHPGLAAQLAVWCRQQGHRWHPADADPAAGPATDGPAGGRRAGHGGLGPVAGGGAGRRCRPRTRWRRGGRAPGPLGSGGPGSGGGTGRAGAGLPTPSNATRCGPTGPPPSTPRPPPASGTRPPPSTGRSPSTTGPRWRRRWCR